MPPATRACPACTTPLPGGAAYCGVCGAGAPEPVVADDPDAGLAQVRHALADRYGVVRVLGEGGTATVYLAQDLRHRREVAIKVLRPEVANLVGAARFLREIEIAARLQHPHILPVYDSGEAEDGDTRLLYYVMPFAAESLAGRLASGGMPLGDAVRVLSQVADALAFAHAAGVVHRDIKPDNVMLTGRHAMVADFGIAKALAAPVPGRSPTGPGVPIGTPYYMAPEQVAADPQVDGRADQYALGVLAYELLAGRRPFSGETVQEVLAAQLLEDPEPLDRLLPDIPPGLAELVMRALAKLPEHRWTRTEELAARLESCALALGTATPPEQALGRLAGSHRPGAIRRALGTGALAAGALGLGAGTAAVVLPSGAATAVPMTDQISFSGVVGLAAVSPDGAMLAYATRDDAALQIQEMAGGTPHEIARGFGHVLAIRWSPDGSRLLVGGRYAGEPGIYILPRLGGTPRRVARARLGQWLPSGRGLSTWDYPDRAVQLWDLDSGASRQVPLPGQYDWLYDAEWSPSGTRLAYVTMTEPNRFALRLTGGPGAAGILVEDTLPIGSPRWAPGDGALYYLRGRAELWKVKVARGAPRPRGRPVALLDGLQAAPSEVPEVAVPYTLTSDARRLIYLKGLDYSNLWLVTGILEGRGRPIATRRLTSGTAHRRGASVSPDGRWIAYLETTTEGTDLYRMPVEGGRPERLTHAGRIASRQTSWSPDGGRIAIAVREGAEVRLATVPGDGGAPRLVGATGLPAMGDLAWSPGGQILYQGAGNRTFLALDPESGEKQASLPGSGGGWVFAAVPSPDGERVAAYWNRRPREGVWVFSRRDASRALLRPGRADPIGWSPDAAAVLTLGWDSADVAQVGLDGRRETLGTLPFRGPSCASGESSGRTVLVCAVPEQVSDVWMVDGFDPERR